MKRIEELPERKDTERARVLNRAADVAHAAFEREGWTYSRWVGDERREWVPSWGEIRQHIESMAAAVESRESRWISSGRIMVRRGAMSDIEVMLEIGDYSAEKRPEDLMAMGATEAAAALLDDLAALLADEDLTVTKLRAAADTLLPRLHDAMRMALQSDTILIGGAA